MVLDSFTGLTIIRVQFEQKVFVLVYLRRDQIVNIVYKLTLHHVSIISPSIYLVEMWEHSCSLQIFRNIVI